MRGLLVGVACLVVLTAAAFRPALHAEFLQWDDQRYIVENPLLRDAEGLRKIWDPREVAYHTQYFPLLVSTYWIEYQLWGLDAHRYHATNLALHSANTVLVCFLMLALGLSPPAALVAAGIFAVHPAQVESVAWVVERKNLLSGLFYLLAFLAYVRYRRGGSRGLYTAMLVSFIAALLSKTQTASLPLSLLVADLALQRAGRLPRAALSRVALRLAPLLVVALLLGLITLRIEGSLEPAAYGLAERAVIAGNALVFYIGTFLLPIDLSPVYPKWGFSTRDLYWWIAPVVSLLGLLAILRWNRRIAPLVLWGGTHFCVSLAPVLGLLPFAYFTYSYVADHHLYLPAIGGAAAIVVIAERLAGLPGASARSARLVYGALAILIAGMSFQTYGETKHWRSNEAFWTHVLSKDPGRFLPNFNLGMHYRRAGEREKALGFLARAARTWPNAGFAFREYVQALGELEGAQAAVAACEAKLVDQPRFDAAHLERAIHLERLGRRSEALEGYVRVQSLTAKDSKTWQEAASRARQLRGGP